MAKPITIRMKITVTDADTGEIVELSPKQLDKLISSISIEEIVTERYCLRNRKNSEPETFRFVVQHTRETKKGKYNLRKRPLENPPPLPIKKRVCREIAKISGPIIPKFISAEPSALNEGMLVLAKMQSYSAWPARIIEIKNKKKCASFFSGTTQQAPLTSTKWVILVKMVH